jgi:hypothetical protein
MRVRDRQDRTFQVFVAAGEQREMMAKRDFLDEQRWRVDAESVLVAIARPPLPPREPTWSVVLGVRDVTTDRVRIFFSREEAERLLEELKRRVPAGRFGPLDRYRFAVNKLSSLL